MASKEFIQFLNKLGYSTSRKGKGAGSEFVYEIPIGSDGQRELRFINVSNDTETYNARRRVWNRNDETAFVVVGEHRTHLFDGKIKPDEHDPTDFRAAIKSFSYGTNTDGFSAEDLKEISRLYVDSAYFFDFVIRNRRSREQSVDKDLLLNLIALRNDLIGVVGDEEIVHSLILRCLFVKYLEDKGIYDPGYLVEALASGKPSKLVSLFEEIKKINGDIFKFKRREMAQSIRPEYLERLHEFFSYDYRSGQGRLFPYMFDCIPIQLISNVYEAFLKNDHRLGKGIYYTPNFLVSFVLNNSLKQKLEENGDSTVFDPAVGSAAILVESFKMIVNHSERVAGRRLSYAAKKKILQRRLFGVDTDTKALELAAFSLYLALIETESPKFIRHKIENSHPILPSLIGSTLIHGNTITDTLFEGQTFDCIVSNPPWGTAKPDGDDENKKERIAIGNQGKSGTMPEYKSVSDFERSQAFLLRVQKWSHSGTRFALIVKNSIFLNDNASDFRREFLGQYDVSRFYELSNYNRILFKERTIGEVSGRPVKIGASEPCVVVLFSNKGSDENSLKYISPKLTDFAESYEVIHYTNADAHTVKQRHFVSNDDLWRVLVKGDFEDFDLIQRLAQFNSELTIECRSGFQATVDMERLGKPDLRTFVEPKNIDRYRITGELATFDFNQKLWRRRNEGIYRDTRLLFPNRPLKSDKFRLRCALYEDEAVHKDNISCIKLKHQEQYVSDYLPYLAIFNSRVIGYVTFHKASQWGIGDLKREKVKNTDIESIPAPHLEPSIAKRLKREVERIFKATDESEVSAAESNIEDILGEVYGLTAYEKEMLVEFYETRVERTGKSKYANDGDLRAYAEEFIETFIPLIADGFTIKLNGLKISSALGAVVCFSIGASGEHPAEDRDLEILELVKQKRLGQADIARILNEQKVKIYDGTFLYILKSNLYRDWTVRQAIRDAREEIGILLSSLPLSNEC